MILWTIQSAKTWEKLQQLNKILRTDLQKVEKDFLLACTWMAKQMHVFIIKGLRKAGKSIQATIWELRMEDVKSFREFIAR